MGGIDLSVQFETRLNDMLNAVKAGRNTHATGNIKASGAALENAFRKLLIDSLPSANKVTSGYFYGASSLCSNEIDVLVYEDNEAFRLNPIGQDQDYVPYTSVSIIGQIKNSLRDLTGAISQIQKAIDFWNKMESEAANSRSQTGHVQDRPVTFIVCGESKESDFKKIEKILKEKSLPFVDYILLLDRGEIIAGTNDILVHDPLTIDFWDYRNKNSLYLCRPESETNGKSISLLWLYFSLVSKINWDHGNDLRYLYFCRQISTQYPLHAYKKLV